MIGIYGGTFNPIHFGHLRAAEEIVEALSLERMIFIPSARPPHKREANGERIAPAALRLEWTRAAVQGNPRFEVDPIEVERPGPSFLVDTMRALRERHTGNRLSFCVGHDAFSEMGTWRDPTSLFELTDIVVTTRPPTTAGRLENWLPECVRGDFEVDGSGQSARHLRADTHIRLLPITALDISASEIRARILEGASIRYLLPAPIRAAVEAAGCYTREPSAGREPLAGREPSAGGEPSAGREPSTGEEPSADGEASARGEPSAGEQPLADPDQERFEDGIEGRAAGG
jgi:nicotinate-nucleotide adenylyltransferase